MSDFETSSNYDELVEFFGASSLARLTREQLCKLKLPSSTIGFLSKVGVPTDLPAASEALGISFSISEGSLPTLATYLRPYATKPSDLADSSRWLKIGSMFEAHLCLVEELGAIHRVDLSGRGKTQIAFVNATLEQLVLFLFQYEKLASPDRKDTGLLEYDIAKFESALRRIDKDAFEHANAWWPAVVFEMKQGLG
jgi:SUKH-4 immunity protein